MGLFSGSGKSADDKAREFAVKKGIDVSDAIAVGRAYQDNAERVMVVRPGRVEVHHLGRTGSLARKGAGVTTLEASRIGSVSTRRQGIWGYLSIQGSGVDVEYRTDVVEYERLADAVRSCGSASPAAAPAQATAPVPPPPAVPAGWYPDQAAGVQRYWDGHAWTEHTAPLT